MSGRLPRTRRASELEALWQRQSDDFGTFMWWIDSKKYPYMSHSRVSTVERCRRCYYAMYVLGEKAHSTAIEAGTLVHRAAQTAYERLQAGRKVDFAALAAKTAKKHSSVSYRSLVCNAITTLSEHLWTDWEIVGVEEPFFLDLSEDLPPVIGVVDLILRRGHDFLVIDHKTGKQFRDADEGQLVLYAEYVRRKYGAAHCDGVFDQYRMVPNLATVRTPVHRRTPVQIGPKQSAALLQRYQSAWGAIQSIRVEADAWRSEGCWFCS